MKKNSRKILFGAGAVLAALGAVDMLIAGNGIPENFVIEDGVMVAVDENTEKSVLGTVPTSLSASTPTPVSSNVLAPRMVGVPSYEAAAMAGRIYNEAINQSAAKEFISLQPTRRNARLQAELQALYARIKESEAAAAEAEARRLVANEGKVSLKATDMTMGNYGANFVNGAQSGIDEAGNAVQGMSQIVQQTFKMTGFNEVNKTMSFQIRDQYFTGVRAGQTIDGYLVGSVDEALKCVPLMKAEQSTVLCLN